LTMPMALYITTIALVSLALCGHGSRVNHGKAAKLEAKISQAPVTDDEITAAVKKCEQEFKDNSDNIANCICSLAKGDNIDEKDEVARCEDLSLKNLFSSKFKVGCRTDHEKRCCPNSADKVECKVLAVKNPQPCKGDFEEWGACDKKCGGGKKKRTYIIESEAVDGGDECPFPRGKTEEQDCNTDKCENCFPADALVETLSGTKQMSDLRVGDAVRSVDGAGKIVFDDVYFFGHADTSTHAEYVSLELEGSQESLQLSARHFIPTCPQQGQRCEWEKHTHVYAHEVQVGDHIWTAVGKQLILKQVEQSSSTTRLGKYNPYTLSGRIVVNGVLASAHSDWVLDEWTPSSWTRFLPSVYQAMFLPGRWLYRVAGPSAADALDVNNPQAAPEKHGYGPEFLAAFVMASVVGFLFVSPSKRLF